MRWRSLNWPTCIPVGRRPRRPKPSAKRISRCSTFAPNCTGFPAAAGNSCWLSTPTRSVRPCASVTVSTWPGCCPLPRRGFAALRRPVRRPLDEGVIEFGGEVILARDARPERDPGLILRVAAASAGTGLPMAASTLARLAASAPELRTPWPRQALKDLLVMLAAGTAAVSTIEALDRTGLWGRLFPEWGAVRDLPPRD